MRSNAGAAPRQVGRTAADLLATPVPFGLPLGASAADGPVVERGIATPASSSPTCSAAPFVRTSVPAQLGGAAGHATRADRNPSATEPARLLAVSAAEDGTALVLPPGR
jgi:hypothetical protein